MLFLAKFKRFIYMNKDADIAYDSFKKCNYFLLLFKRTDTNVGKTSGVCGK